MKVWKKYSLFAVSFLLAIGGTAQVYAQQSSSTHYGVDQAKFGTGGVLDATSDHYRAQQGSGDVFAGPTAGTAFKSNVGVEAPDEPVLEFIVNSPISDLGELHSGETAFGAADVWVKAYRSSGYNMYITGTAPAQTVHTIARLTEPSTSQTGVEQFGLNLRENNTPSVGADPIQVPNDDFSFGVPAPDYDTPDFFMYQPNDLIAQSAYETGQTRYKLSYIVNVAPNTPAGRYVTNLSVVVSPKF